MRLNSSVLGVRPGILRFFGSPCAKLAVVFIIGFCLLLQAGCEEQVVTPKQTKIVQAEDTRILPPKESKTTTAPPKAVVRTQTLVTETKVVPDAKGPAPKIMFEKVVHDFGKVSPGSRPKCEFTFKNAGESLLKISRVQSTCGCTAANLTKKEYKPGESGTLNITYTVGQRAMSTRKYVYVHSNDPANPKVTLTIKATIVTRVAFEPKRLNLLLERENADCSKITLTSVEGKKFSITGLKSTGDCITADIDSSIQATKFVLEPKVDAAKLKKYLNGNVVISVNHPDLKEVTIPYYALSRFKISPPMLYVLNTEPGKTITRDIWVFNNYGEAFEIESVSSKNGSIKVLSQQKISKGYQCKVEITPPPVEGSKRAFSDVLTVKIKDGEELVLSCTGTYSPKVFQKQ